MKDEGFALILALLLLLILTLFGFSLLLIAGSYHSSAKNLFGNENARLACEQACKMMIDRHNLELDEPRFFVDPELWISQKLTRLEWNGYEISAETKTPWKSAGDNTLKIFAKQGRFESIHETLVRQIRPEDFALYTETSILLNHPSLFHGRVLIRNGLQASIPTVRFRSLVQGEVFPDSNASFKMRSEQVLNYPPMGEFIARDQFFSEAVRNGVLITGSDPVFWTGVRYEVDLDRLDILREGSNRWRIRYNGLDVAVTQSLHLWFDDHLAIRQTYSALPDFRSGKIDEPLYLGSASDVVIESSIQPLEFAANRHPLCLIASDAVYISTFTAAPRIKAFLLAFGADDSGGTEAGLIVNPGTAPLSTFDHAIFADEIRGSVFMVETEKREEMMSALLASQKLVWIRGSVFLQSGISMIPDLDQMHFEATSEGYSFLPSFPFVRLVEGSSIWL